MEEDHEPHGKFTFLNGQGAYSLKAEVDNFRFKSKDNIFFDKSPNLLNYVITIFPAIPEVNSSSALTTSSVSILYSGRNPSSRSEILLGDMNISILFTLVLMSLFYLVTTVSGKQTVKIFP